MNRADKIAKLAHAVKEWRGVSHPKTGAWLKMPHPKAQRRVEKWMLELGINPEEGVKQILGFEKYVDFYAWVRAL